MMLTATNVLVPTAVVVLVALALYLWRPRQLPPPGTRVFTPEELARYNGTDPSLPVYIAVKKTVFDVTSRRTTYSPGGSYSVLGGRDASKALGINSLKPEDCIADTSELTKSQMAKLDGWHAYYARKYPTIGTVTDTGSGPVNLPIATTVATPVGDPLKTLKIGEKRLTPDELFAFNGTNNMQPVYVAIKGVIFDVSNSRESYEPGKSYHVFAGKDPSKALGMSSLKSEDCVPDYSSLSPKHLETLDQWLSFFAKKYPAVGRVVSSK